MCHVCIHVNTNAHAHTHTCMCPNACSDGESSAKTDSKSESKRMSPYLMYHNASTTHYNVVPALKYIAFTCVEARCRCPVAYSPTNQSNYTHTPAHLLTHPSIHLFTNACPECVAEEQQERSAYVYTGVTDGMEVRKFHHAVLLSVMYVS